jgi:hypothetical protein
LKALSKRDLTREDISAIIDAIKTDPNDRGVALTLGSVVETGLYRFIRSWIVPELDSTEENQLFGGDAPMGTLSSRIRVAYAFGLINQDIRDSLDIFREIRNAFAHSAALIWFETPQVDAACQRLSLGEGRRIAAVDDTHSMARGAYIAVASALLFTFAGCRKSETFGSDRLPVTFDVVWKIVQTVPRQPSAGK